jgi:hypothetical protein
MVPQNLASSFCTQQAIFEFRLLQDLVVTKLDGMAGLFWRNVLKGSAQVTSIESGLEC